MGLTGRSAARYRGRGQARRVVRRIAVAPQQDVTAGAQTSSSLAMLRSWRWLKELQRLSVSDASSSAANIGHVMARLDTTFRTLGGVWQERLGLLPGAGLSMLEDWAVEAEQQYRAAQAADAGKRRKSWQLWVRDCVHRRPGLLFRWIRGETVPPTTAVQVGERWTLDPEAIVERAAAGVDDDGWCGDRGAAGHVDVEFNSFLEAQIWVQIQLRVQI